MTKNLIYNSSLTRLAQIWIPKTFFVGFTSSTCYKLLQAVIACNFKEGVLSKLKKMPKNLILGLI